MLLSTPDEFRALIPGEAKKKDRAYEFDEVFPANFVPETRLPKIPSISCRAHSMAITCIFAYGQTGVGKTYTIYGDDANPGLTPRAISEVMRCGHRDSNKCSVKMECYMLELYRDDLIDLLLPQGALRRRNWR